MTTAYQLPDDIGRKRVVRNGVEVQAASEFPAGQTSGDNSLPIVMPREDYVLPIIDNYRFASEVNRDMLGFPRATRPYNFLTRNDAYELTEEDWIFDVTGLNERPEIDGTESARWTQLSETSAFYPATPNGEIKYNQAASSAQLILNSNEGGFQRARIATKQRYRYQPGRIVRASLAVRMSVDSTPVSVRRMWGVGDPNDGFFLECSGDGVGDRLQIVYRTSGGNGLRYETRIPRSQWNGDHVDGSGKSKQSLDLSKTFMTLIEWGWYGASDVRFYFFLVDKDEELPTSITQIPRARWILAHELILADTQKRNDLREEDGSGSLRSYDIPSLSSPSLPIWVEITNSGNLARSEYIERYGASVLVDGGGEDKAKITTVDASFGKAVEPVVGGLYSGAGQSVMTIRSKARFPNNTGETVENLLVTNPLMLNVGASDMVELEIWKDPVMVSPTEAGHVNGRIPYRNGDYVSPFNLVPQLITSFDDTGAEFAITQEDPTGEFLTVDTQYESGDLLTLDVSFNDYRVVQSGKRIGSFIVGPTGSTIDLRPIFGGQREQISSEFDSPPEFPVKSDSITVQSFNPSTGLITVASAFPLRLTLGQRISKGSTNYYVHTLNSSRSFTIKAAKVNTTPVTTGIAAGDTLVAHYELDLERNVASRLKPVYNTEIVFVARPFGASYTKLDKAAEYNAEWMNLVNTTSSDAYSVQTAPTVNMYLTNGVS
jgi:hypothetical protein